MPGKGLPRESSLLFGESLNRRVLSNVTLRSLRLCTVEHVVNEIVYLAKGMRLEVDYNDIDELAEEHNQELGTEEFMEFHCVSQQEVTEECLSEEEEITAK
ncbi:hypothetical protein AVEN_177990-1 [Araneus ventricosus]|uniref:Uncharacterized protein n=1 Tax=Araneus ventricosus TaxID=182803 RepID=A0A4Y2EJ14_ARAVE|nr:hypothetical protein AVEN_177990-1 [Araneus ventricosus]